MKLLWCSLPYVYHNVLFSVTVTAAERMTMTRALRQRHCCKSQRFLNPLMGALKPHISAPLYSSTVIGTWPLMGGLLYLVQGGEAWAGYDPAQSPARCTKCNSPSVNG